MAAMAVAPGRITRWPQMAAEVRAAVTRVGTARYHAAAPRPRESAPSPSRCAAMVPPETRNNKRRPAYDDGPLCSVDTGLIGMPRTGQARRWPWRCPGLQSDCRSGRCFVVERVFERVNGSRPVRPCLLSHPYNSSVPEGPPVPLDLPVTLAVRNTFSLRWITGVTCPFPQEKAGYDCIFQSEFASRRAGGKDAHRAPVVTGAHDPAPSKRPTPTTRVAFYMGGSQGQRERGCQALWRRATKAGGECNKAPRGTLRYLCLTKLK